MAEPRLELCPDRRLEYLAGAEDPVVRLPPERNRAGVLDNFLGLFSAGGSGLVGQPSAKDRQCVAEQLIPDSRVGERPGFVSDFQHERGFVAAGAVRSGQPVKVLGNGEISVAVQVTANAFSTSAKDKIAAAGGSTTEL